ncbi:MAG: polyketide synthase dehydratase domain-containing protein, partial [Acetobacteraceae bacterium]|nr:polyketide synthase dehydratase domain-containing protein [Acetobacteraceae bacterium]
LETPDRLHETWLTQPALFAFEYALAELWQSWGIRPAAVLGHSVGEYVAACIAGVFSLEEGLELIAIRAQLMADQPEGAMLAVDAPAGVLDRFLAAYPEDLATAAYNGPGSVVLSGRTGVVRHIEEELTEQRWACRRLSVSHAFHSPLMKPVTERFRGVLEKIALRPVRIPLVCNLTGEFVRDDTLGVDYWLQHLCKPVRFEQSVQRLVEHHYRLFLEIGPKPVLCGLARRIISDHPDVLLLAPSKGSPDEAKHSEWASLLSCLAQLYVHGVNPDWGSVSGGFDHRRVALPFYPLERRRHWLPAPSAGLPGAIGAHPHRLHPLLDRCEGKPAEGGAIYRKRLTAQDPLLRDHHVQGAAWFPATAFLDMAFAAARFHTGTPSIRIDETIFSHPLQVGEKEARLVQVEVKPDGVRPDQLRLRITSITSSAANRDEDTPPNQFGSMLQEHVQALLSYGPNRAIDEKLDVAAVERRCDRRQDPTELYALFQQAGIRYGPYFQGIEWMRYNDGEVLARLRLSEVASRETGHLLHPALVDNALQAFGAAFLSAEPGSSADYLFVPLAVGGVQIYASLTADIYCHATRHSFKGGVLKGSMRLLDGEGSVLADVDEVALRRVARTTTSVTPATAMHAERTRDEVRARVSKWLHKPVWRPASPPGTQPWNAGVTLLLMDEAGLGKALADALNRLGERCIAVRTGTAFSDHGNQVYTLDPGEPD